MIPCHLDYWTVPAYVGDGWGDGWVSMMMMTMMMNDG
jgi:hypothetical protein